MLDGDINALLDFRYTQDPALSWYFDHHKTAFPAPGDWEHCQADRSGRRFHDPNYGSCTRLLADLARERFGFHDPALDDLVRWADLIDSASFDSPEQALRRDQPAMQIMAVIEQHGDSAFLGKLVPQLASLSLDHVASTQLVKKRWRPLERRLARLVDRIRSRSTVLGRVVFTDLSDALSDIIGRFVPYALFPTSVYSVVLSRSRSRIKVSVGFNPWSPAPRDRDIAELCAHFGGGGHAVVGAIAFALDQLEIARETALSIARQLDG